VPGILRLFNAEFGGQVSWLLPLAAGATGLGLWVRRHAPRTDARRAGYLLWGGWLAVHVLVFSFMSGIIHSYYAVVMAPAIGALVGAGIVELWRLRARTAWAGVVLGAAILGSAVWAWALLERTPDFVPGLGVAIVAVALFVAVVVALPAGDRWGRGVALAVGLGIAVLVAAPAAYAVDTMGTAYSGGTVAAGPAVAGSGGGPGIAGRAPGAGTGTVDGGGAPGLADGDRPAGAPPTGAFPGGVAPTGGPGLGRGGGLGGQVDAALTDYLAANQGVATWIVAVSGAEQAGSIQLATGLPVMAMGGFNGGDPAPTLDQLKAYVASGQLRYVLVGGGGGPNGGSSTITDWVTANGTLVSEVGDGSLYDLSALATGG
jgi:4-amino-4-deoxy-L-arabinose transferase-like glycosyltransferase